MARDPSGLLSVRYYEDFRPGDEYDLGECVVSEAEIVEFAADWDPQYFHLDPVAAVDGPFGGIVASGWQICAAWMRAWDDAVLARAATLGLSEAEDIRWLVPWRPDQRLLARAIVLEPAPAAVRVRAEMHTPEGTLASSMIVSTPVAPRPA